MRTIKIIHSLCLVLPLCTSISHAAQQSSFIIGVSNGPFAKQLTLSDAQNDFSPWWKANIKAELGKPVNFAGKYRLFVSPGGHGK